MSRIFTLFFKCLKTENLKYVNFGYIYDGKNIICWFNVKYFLK